MARKVSVFTSPACKTAHEHDWTIKTFCELARLRNSNGNDLYMTLSIIVFYVSLGFAQKNWKSEGLCSLKLK